MSDFFKIIDLLVQSKKNLNRLSSILLLSLTAYIFSFKLINHFQFDLLAGVPEGVRSLCHFVFLVIIISFVWNHHEKIPIKIKESITWASGRYYRKGENCFLQSPDFIRVGIIRDIEDGENRTLEIRSSGAGIISRKGCFSSYSVKFVAKIRNLHPEPSPPTNSISGFGFISHAIDHDNYFMLKVDINEPNSVLSVGPLIKRDNILYIPDRDIRTDYNVKNEGEKFQFVFEVTKKSTQVKAYKITDHSKESDIFHNKAIYYLPEKYETVRSRHNTMINSNNKSLEYSGVENTLFPKLNKFGFRADGPEVLEAENLTLEVG